MFSPHAWEFTAGVTSDTKPVYLIQEYMLGRKTKEEILAELTIGTSVRQLCLHSQPLCDTIKPTKAYILNGKELDINEYRKKR